MINPDLSLEYSYIKLPYDCVVKSNNISIRKYNNYKNRFQIVKKKCWKRDEFSAKWNNSDEKWRWNYKRKG